MRSADFDSDDINTIIKILTERNYLYSAVPKTSKGSIPIEDFLENFWDYDKSPYVREKLGKKQSQFHSNGHSIMSSLRTIVLTESLSVLTSAKNERFLIWKLQTNLWNLIGIMTKQKSQMNLPCTQKMRAGEIQALTVDNLGELNLSEEDAARISQRFGIA